MKRIILLVCLIAGTLGAYSQVTWNLKAGAGLSALEGTNYEGDNSIRIVGKIGVGMEVPLNRNLSFMPSLEFAMKGGKWSFENVNHNETFSAYYVQIPILVGYRFFLGKSWNMVFKAGPYVAYGLFGNVNVDNPYYSESGDLFGDVGFSRLDLGAEIGMDFECRKFVIGFDIEKGLRGHEVIHVIKHNAAYINIGFKL